MPLLRSQGNSQTFKQATTPAGWTDGDIWVNTSDGSLNLNKAGTSQRIYSGTITRGGIQYGSSANNMSNLVVGTNNQGVKSDGTDVSWGATGTTLTKQSVDLGADFSSASATFVDATGMTVTMPNRAGSIGLVIFIVNWNSGAAINAAFRIVDGATNLATISQRSYVNSTYHLVTLVAAVALTGQAVKLQIHSDGTNTMTVIGTDPGTSQIRSNETT